MPNVLEATLHLYACFIVVTTAELALPSTRPSGLDNTWIAVTALAFVSSGSGPHVVRRRPHRPLG